MRQPETVLPSSQVSPSEACTTPSPQYVQSPRHVGPPGSTPGGSQVSGEATMPSPHVGVGVIVGVPVVVGVTVGVVVDVAVGVVVAVAVGVAVAVAVGVRVGV